MSNRPARNFKRFFPTKVVGALLLLLGLQFIFTFLPAQGLIRLNGRVSEGDGGNPLAFARIQAKTQNLGTFSDVDGWFELALNRPDSVQIRFVGYETVWIFVSEDTSGLEVMLKPGTVEVEAVEITADANPGLEIAKKVVENRDRNDIFRQKEFSYDSYNKLKVYPVEDSVEGITMLEDSAFLNVDFLIWETVTKVKFAYPNKRKEEVLASRTSGYEGEAFPLTASDLQSVTFYDERINIMNEIFVSPFSGKGLKMYKYTLEEVIPDGADTLFLIGFGPRKNNFDAVEGRAWIDAKTWGIRQVKAEIRIAGNKILLDKGRVQQMYAWVADSLWVPKQLNTDVKLLPFSPQLQNELIFSGRSYIKNFSLESGVDEEHFDENSIVVVPEAVEQTDSILAEYREEALTERELRSYEILDSVGKAAKLNLVVDQFYKLQYSHLQLFFLDFDLNRIWHGNDVEGYRPGIGLYTNEDVSPYFRLGGYYGYGLKDRQHKFGGSLTVFPNGNDDFVIGAGFDRDLEETGGRRLGIEPEVPLFRNTYREAPSRTAYLDQMEYTEDTWGFFSFRPSDNLTFRADYSQEWVRPAYEYSFQGHEQFRFEELTGTVRWAPGETFTNDGTHKFVVENKLPILRMRWRKGMTLFGGMYQYDIFDWSANHEWVFGKGHRLRYRLNGGVNTGVVPYSKMYTFRANYHPQNYFDGPNTFNTMAFHEFAANQYFSGFINLRPKQNWLKFGEFKPRFSFVLNAAWGKINSRNDGQHSGLDLSAPEKGYYEGGVILQNILPIFRKQNVVHSLIQALGVSGYYRFGPYTHPDWKKNFAIRLYTSF